MAINNLPVKAKLNKSILYKLISAVVIAFIIVLSFLAGYLVRENKITSVNASQAKIKQAAAAEFQENELADSEIPPPGTVQVSPAKQQMMGIKIGIVQKGSRAHTLKVPGRVAADETKVYRINAAIEGWIIKIYNKTTGSVVRKDELLALYSSPNFLSAQQAYIYALSAQDRAGQNNHEPAQQTTLIDRNIQQYKDTLITLGMTETQIGEIKKTRQYTDYIQIRAPGPGFILQRNISDGLRFDKGTELYKIADLSRVWILADLYENEEHNFQPGKSVNIVLPGQNKKLKAQVSSILPQFDPASRTMKVRLIADNPGFLLRPDMFVDVELPIISKPAIFIPSDAILDTGLKKTVFVLRKPGLFEPRLVSTGRRLGNEVEIESGLEEGERIVLSGNFLLDAESKMELSANGINTALEVDPVCGSGVVPKKANTAGRKSLYKQKVYYFCSDECKQLFDHSQERYAKKYRSR